MRLSIHQLVATLLILWTLSGIGDATASPISVFGNSSQYGIVDSQTGVYTQIGVLTDSTADVSVALSGFAFGSDSRLYGVTGIDGPGGAGEGNVLWQFDAETGLSTGQYDLDVSFVTLARRPSDNQLFGYANNAADGGNLYQLDLSNRTTNLVGATGLLTFGALTFDNNDRLYLANTFNGDIYRVDTATATTTLFASSSVREITGMAVVNNSLYAFSTFDHGMYAIDLDSGITRFERTYQIGGNAGGDLIYGAAIRPLVTAVVPEPTSLVLVLLSVCAIVIFSPRGIGRVAPYLIFVRM